MFACLYSTHNEIEVVAAGWGAVQPSDSQNTKTMATTEAASKREADEVIEKSAEETLDAQPAAKKAKVGDDGAAAATAAAPDAAAAAADADAAAAAAEGSGDADDDMADGGGDDAAAVAAAQAAAAVPVTLGYRTFASGAAAHHHIGGLLKAWHLGQDLNEYELVMVLDLLRKGHPRADEKVWACVAAVCA